MQRKPFVIATLILTALATVWRVLLLPVAAGDGHSLTHLNPLLLGMIAAVTLVLLLLGRTKTSYASLTGNGAKTVAAGAQVFAVVLAAVSVRELFDWLVNGVSPAPAVTEAAMRANNVLLAAICLFGLAGAAFLLWYFTKWRRAAYLSCNSRCDGWLWLLPVLWLFARLARYNMLYATSVDITPFAYDGIMYAVALLFMFAFACYMSGALRPTRFLRGLAATTTVLSISAMVSRLIFLCMGLEEAAAYCPLPGLTDAALGVFAFTVAGSLTEQTAQPDTPADAAPSPAVNVTETSEE